MGLTVRHEQLDICDVTVIDGIVEGPSAVDELVEMVRLVVGDRSMSLDVDPLSGLTANQRDEFLAAVEGLVTIVGGHDRD